MRKVGPVRAGVLTLVLAAVLTGCMPEPAASPSATSPETSGPTGSVSPSSAPTESAAPSPAPSSSATPTATPTPSDPAAAPLVIPDCDALVTSKLARTVLGDGAELYPASRSIADVMPGPVAAETARTALSSRVCTWIIPASDGGFVVAVAELTPSASAELMAALAGAGTFTQSTLAGAPAYTREYESDLGAYAVTYVFDGAAWVTAVGSLTQPGSRTVAESALDAVRAVNPGL